MDLEDIKRWIIEKLKGLDNKPFFDEKQGIGARLINVNSPDDKKYNGYYGYIKYLINDNRTIYFTHDNLADSTGFSYSTKECTKEKLDKLIQNIEEKFSEDGNFYIESAKGEFKLIKI